MAERTESYFGMISGEDERFRAKVVRGVTRVVSWAYGFGMWLRNKAYDFGIKQIYRSKVPVISIGNITTGGTGKTPVVIDVARTMHEKGLRVGIILRGFKGEATGGSDEAELMRESLPEEVLIEVYANRVAGAKVLEKQVDIILLDDGFQHRRLGRKLDVVIVDVTRPWGYGYVLPRGLLREPMKGLKRAHVIILSRLNQVSEEVQDEICQDISRYVKRPPLMLPCDHVWGEVVDQTGKVVDVGGRGVFGFCGIGNPGAFFEQVGSVSELKGQYAYEDHHAYTVGDLEKVQEMAIGCGVEFLMTTEKDWVKIRRVVAGKNVLHLPICRPKLGIAWVRDDVSLAGLGLRLCGRAEE